MTHLTDLYEQCKHLNVQLLTAIKTAANLKNHEINDALNESLRQLRTAHVKVDDLIQAAAES